MTLNEPILVVAETPRGCCDVVWGLLELIKPVPFGGDFRPYFTIQDEDFKGLIMLRRRTLPVGTVLGVTNPAITKALEHWPNVIRVIRVGGKNREPMGRGSPILGPGVLSAGSMTVSPTGAGVQGLQSSASSGEVNWVNGSTSPARAPPITTHSTSPNAKSTTSGSGSTVKSFMSSFSRARTPEKRVASSQGAVGYGTAGNPVAFESVVESLLTKHKPYFTKDKRLVKEVVEAAIRGFSASKLDNMLRRHFIELTDRFLQPLNRFFEGLVVGSPVGMNLSTLRSRPEIKPFRQETFLKTIETSCKTVHITTNHLKRVDIAPAMPVQNRRPLVDFYRQFLKSPNFGLWLQTRTADLNREWKRHYFGILCDANIAEWVAGGAGGDERNMPKQEVECVDLLLRMRDELKRYAKYFKLDPSSLAGARSSQMSAASLAASSASDLPDAGEPLPAQPSPQSLPPTFVPTAEQYSRLSTQANTLLGLISEELRVNIKKDGLESGAGEQTCAGGE
ncbi:Protein dennd6a [Irineochytrium annulatum]|nr:Protein dennd6a [Irineochytrium annulatum]